MVWGAEERGPGCAGLLGIGFAVGQAKDGSGGFSSSNPTSDFLQNLKLILFM